MTVFKHILFATDFSPASKGALDIALAVTRDCGSTLTVMHACEVPTHVELDAPLDVLAPVIEHGRARLEKLVGSLREAHPGVREMLKVGVAWEQILAAVGESKADLIVMGTHGRRGVEHALMGSVAERVVQLSPIPVLTVPVRK